MNSLLRLLSGEFFFVARYSYNISFIRRDVMADKRVIRFFGCERQIRHIQRCLLPFIYLTDDPIYQTQSIKPKLPFAASWCHILPTDSNSPDSMTLSCLEPVIVLEVQESTFGISDVVWDPNLGLLVLGSSDSSLLSRLDSYLTNTHFPWEPCHDPIPMGRISFWKYKPGRIKRRSSFPRSSIRKSSFSSFQYPTRLQSSDVSSSVLPMQCLDPLLHVPSELLEKSPLEDEPLFRPYQPSTSIHEQQSNETSPRRTSASEPSYDCDPLPISNSKIVQEPPRFELIKFLDLQSQVTGFFYERHQGHLFASLSNGKVEYFTIRSSGLEGRSDRDLTFTRLSPLVQPGTTAGGFPDTLQSGSNATQSNSSICSPIQPSYPNTPLIESPEFPNICVYRQSSCGLGYLLPHHSDKLTCLAYDHRRHLLFSGSSDSSLKVFNFR